jgi:biofilm PGA synthesis N-glycosyltransferase PgaC
MNKYKYAIITPAYNEAEFLPQVIESILNQNEQPFKWIIVDDRSTDNTWTLINSAAKRRPIIEPVQLFGSKERRVGANVVHVFEAGLKRLSEKVDFLVKMDADVILRSDYFARITKYFKNDPALGMASGKTYIQQANEWVLERIPDTHVSGACKSYRSECFTEIGGLIPLLGWDILDGAKARMKGWKTRSFRDLPLYHLRQSSSARGIFRGRMRTGRAMYTIRAHPLFVLGKSLFRGVEKPYLTSLLIPIGYLASFLTKPQRLEELELANFLRREQISRLMGKTRDQEEWLPRRFDA